jgi:hypothetical protein
MENMLYAILIGIVFWTLVAALVVAGVVALLSGPWLAVGASIFATGVIGGTVALVVLS